MEYKYDETNQVKKQDIESFIDTDISLIKKSHSKAFAPLINDALIRRAKSNLMVDIDNNNNDNKDNDNNNNKDNDNNNNDYTPIWCHRQAGRYLPEYHLIRSQSDFFTICKTPHLASEITIQPIKRFNNIDAAIIFSDILVIPKALGMDIKMVKGKGPVFVERLQNVKDFKKRIPKYKDIDVNKSLGYVYNAITLTRKELNGKVPLIGFVGSPWTLMAYMIQGEGSKSYYKAKHWLYQYPKESHELLQLLTDCCVDFLIGQIKAGAQYVQVFDSWAGDLSKELFYKYDFPYLKQISQRVKKQIDEMDLGVPIGVFPKGADYAMEKFVTETEFDVMSLDWTIESKDAADRLRKCYKETGKTITLQGNIDPAALFGTKENIEKQVKVMLDGFKGVPHIANLGHGMLPTHKPIAVEIYSNFVHAYTSK